MNKIFLSIVVLTTIYLSACNMEKKEVKNPAIDLNNMDLSVKPGDNFFEFVNGNWIKNNPVPDEYSSYAAFTKLYEENQLQLQEIVKEASASQEATQGSIHQKIRDLYNSAMDTVAINEIGIKAIEKDLANIDAIDSKAQLAEVIAELNKFSVAPFFGCYPGADKKNASMVIVNLYQGGLNLPDRDYYLNTDERFVEIQKKYVEFINKMFVLTGETEENAKHIADQIFEIETSLAKVSMDRIERRDPNKTYNKLTVSELNKLCPAFDWNTYFTGLTLNELEDLNVCMPQFVEGLNKIINDTDLDAIKAYMKWNILLGFADFLSDDFVEESFNFYAKFLSGQKTMRPRWKRVLDVTSGCIGEGIGQLYVEKHFPPKAKEQMVELVGNLRTSLGKRIEKLEWMSSETKEKALVKLSKINVKVGYPDKWIDYSGLEIVPDSYITNIKNVNLFEFNREIAKVGKPVDKDEWHMTPQTVNAYYSPTMNEIVFPAGILQPPFFNMDADDAVNYGGIGVVIGHEMTHGFDDQGRKYDENGNLNDWWTEEDARKFNERTKQLVKLYSEFAVLDTNTVNGELTLGENIADLGGLMISWDALQIAAQDKTYPDIDGYTFGQRFFMGYAQIWRQTIREKALLRNLMEDVHSPAVARVNRALFSMPHFYECFEISPEDKLYIAPEERASIW